MKKILFGLLLLSTPCYANQISLGTISADATASGFQDNFNTLANVINGNIEGSTDGGASVSNIKADSVYAINMADDANPQVRDQELLTNTVDTFSSGTLQQNTFVASGCVPATDVTLTSSISACVAYINGYRVSKGATSQTYQASMDTYVDISQTGVYTLTPVSIGATQPAVAANSARIALVTTSGTAITTSTDLARRSLAGLATAINYRSGLVVSKDSSTTITIMPGTAEINSFMVPKTSTTTLTISTAGDWQGGVSLRAANTYGFVGIDSSGTYKLHTTAPTHTNYAVSQTVGKKRYATWSSTVHRILGWFYMDSAQLIENASNIKEGDVPNFVTSSDNNVVLAAETSFSTDRQRVNFYSSGGPLRIHSIVSGDPSASLDIIQTEFFRGTTQIVGSGASASGSAGAKNVTLPSTYADLNRPQGSVTYNNRFMVPSNDFNLRRRYMEVEEK